MGTVAILAQGAISWLATRSPVLRFGILDKRKFVDNSKGIGFLGMCRETVSSAVTGLIKRGTSYLR